MAKREKKVIAQIKMQIRGGMANPSPPVGPALGQYGVNIMDFCTSFNNRTEDQRGEVIPTILTVYEDRSFRFITKSPPASALIKKAARISRGSGRPNEHKAGSITQDQLREIAEEKMPDLNAATVEAAMRTIAGTAKSMGVEIRD